MGLTQLANLGEFIGGVAVLITLLYLAAQTRNNTLAIRSATFAQIADSFSAISLAVFQDPTAAALLVKTQREASALTLEERTRYTFLLRSFARRAENLFFQSDSGHIDLEAVRGHQAPFVRALATEVGRSWWNDHCGDFNPRFRAFVDHELEADDQGRPGAPNC